MFRGKLVAKFLVLLVVVLGFLSFTCAEGVDLEKIVVTPYRYGEFLEKIASSVSVVSSDDIDNSNAENITDTLRSVPGITVSNWYGNGSKVAVDIAGFGEQAALNVLVLVDGRRINDVDLSGVDWSQIPLEHVERIEVIRGGSAAVLYGDNASSGVINIITKKGTGKPKVNLQAEYGSYDMNGQKLSFSGEVDNNFLFWLSAGRRGTHGYRNNTFNKNSDFASKLEYKLSDILLLHLDSGFYTSTYGLPGALYQVNIDQYGRRYARYGDDHVNNKDYYFVLGSKGELSGLGCLDIDFTYRKKDTDSYFLTSGLYTQRNKIESYGINPKYTLNNGFLGRDNKFISGLDLYRTFYNSDKYDQSNDSDLRNYTNINKTSISGYLQNEFSVFKQLVLLGGYRYEVARYAFGYHDNTLPPWNNPDIDSKIKPKMEAFNTGIVYNYKEDSSLFIDINKSFRFPEVDEFTYNDASWQQQLNTNLKPQSAINYQVGLRHTINEKFKINLSLFRMNVKNEIYYNADGGPTGYGQNENYDKTTHEGLESSLVAKLNSWVIFSGNYSFTSAFFDGGENNQNAIPMVPRHKASLGVKLTLPMNFIFNLTGNYIGKRYFLNDQANAYSQLNGYMIVDTNLSWHSKDLTVTFGINNLFNKKYSEYAGVLLSASGIYPAGSKFYYPSPERNFSLKASYSF